MVSSAVQNLSDFLKNRPPLVVFLLCLVALTVSTFYFAFEIKKDGLIVDSDKKHDWIQLLKHFNKLDVCVNSSTWTDEINVLEDAEQFKYEISVFTKVTIENSNVFDHSTEVYGTLSLEGWQSTTCQDSQQPPKNVDIFFDVPLLAKGSNGSIEVCVTIKGPAQYLPLLLKEPPCKPTGKNKNSKAIKRLLSSKLPRAGDPKFCEKGDVTKLAFDLTEPVFDNYISDDVRAQIYVHLIWCSYFVVFVILCIVFFSILRKSDYLDKKEQSARLL